MCVCRSDKSSCVNSCNVTKTVSVLDKFNHVTSDDGIVLFLT